MRMPLLIAVLLLAAPGPAREVIDCVAATASRSVVTRSGVEEQARITAFLNHTPVDLSPENLRRTADRLIDVRLIRREMEISRYAAPEATEVDKTLAGLRTKDFPAELEKYGIDEAALRRYLTLETQTLRFVELRFRPGTNVSDREVEAYFRDTFLPDFQRRNPGKPVPEVDDVRDRIEDTLQDQQIDHAMEEWLKESRAQARVTYFPGSCPLAAPAEGKP